MLHPRRQRRLIGVVAIVAGVGIAVGLVLYALQQNVNLFYSPRQIQAGEAPEGRVIRVGGLVVDGSVQRDPESLDVSFAVTDNDATVTVLFSGILPDLFREGQGIVARGVLEGQGLRAQEVLAKHDENYMPPEVADSLRQAHVEGVMSTLQAQQ